MQRNHASLKCIHKLIAINRVCPEKQKRYGSEESPRKRHVQATLHATAFENAQRICIVKQKTLGVKKDRKGGLQALNRGHIEKQV
jgi:hypothetical protein